MGASGAIIMSFFGAVFAAMTLAMPLGRSGAVLFLPFAVFAVIAVVAVRTMRRKEQTPARSARKDRVIMWSSAAEGIGIFIAANVVINLGRPELLLPAIALIVGLHFLPMAHLIPFRPFYALAGALLVAAALGFVLHQPIGAGIAGFVAAFILWTAALLALQRTAGCVKAG